MIFVYRNLARKGTVWSVKSTRTGRVVARSGEVVVTDAELVVSEAGRRRVLKERCKNVHAGIRGTWCRGGVSVALSRLHVDRGGTFAGRWVKVKYNPYKAGHFVNASTGRALRRTRVVVLGQDAVWALLG